MNDVTIQPIPFTLWTSLPAQSGGLPVYACHRLKGAISAGDVARGIRAAFIGKPYLRECYKAGLALQGLSLSALASDVWRQAVKAKEAGTGEVCLVVDLAEQRAAS